MKRLLHCVRNDGKVLVRNDDKEWVRDVESDCVRNDVIKIKAEKRLP